MNTNPWEFKKEAGGGPGYPVEQVTWQDAVNFCDELSKLPEGRPQRLTFLPTEAEWEYACRAGTTTAYYFPAIRQKRRRIDLPGIKTTASGKSPGLLDSFKPNPWGRTTCTGNVWEWCFTDYYEENYYHQKAGKDVVIKNAQPGAHHARRLFAKSAADLPVRQPPMLLPSRSRKQFRLPRLFYG